MSDQVGDHASQYDRPAVTVDSVILTLRQGQLHVLLMQRKHWPYEGAWAIPGGFVNAVAFPLLPETFALVELRQVYEQILAEKLEEPVFRRQVLAAGILQPTAHVRGSAGYPARLYRFREEALSQIRASHFFP